MHRLRSLFHSAMRLDLSADPSSRAKLRRRVLRTTVLAAASLGLMLLQGCSTPQRQAKILQVNPTVQAITYPSDVRGAYVIQRPDGVRVCAEPAPDVALDSLQKLTAELSAKLAPTEEGKAKVSSELSAKVVQLAGRSELLLLARELLYRACELSNNAHVDDETVIKLYDRVARLVEHLGQADKASAEAELLREQRALENAGRAIDEVLRQ